MRKLGQGQSVVFYVPDDIQRKILAATGKDDRSSINVPGVLIWALHESWRDLRASMALWATQGRRFHRQRQLWDAAKNESSYMMSQGEAEQFLEDEAMSLETRYRPRKKNEERLSTGPELAHCAAELEISKRCEQFACVDFSSAQLQEEQERELSPEIEQERQIERPPAVEPHQHSLHPAVIAFVKTGIIKDPSDAFTPAFKTLRRTSAAAFFDLDCFPSQLQVTNDFARTVKLLETADGVDMFERPVQWILTSFSTNGAVKHVVVISPFEANKLHDTISGSRPTHVAMHVYAPRINAAFRPLDGLGLYTVPTQLPQEWNMRAELRLQLNLFAGQLYFASRNDYIFACNYLSLEWRRPTDKKEEGAGRPLCQIQADGFILPTEMEQEIASDDRNGPVDLGRRLFFVSPTKFLQVFFSRVRRDCEAIDRTEWGRLLAGDLLLDWKEEKEAE